MRELAHASLDLQLTIGGYVEGLRGWSQKRPGARPDYKLFQFFDGDGQTAVDDYWHTHQHNEIVLIPAHRVIRHRSRSAIRLGWIHFRPLSPRFDAMLGHLERPVVIATAGDDILPWRDVSYLLRQGQSLGSYELHALVSLWAVKALRAAQGKGGVRVVVNDDPLCAKLHRYIERHYLLRPSLEELAGYVGLSPGHIQKRFKKNYGYSPHAAVQRYLMADVLDALRATDDSLEILAERYGFSDRFHLSKAIKRHYDMSAVEIRHGDSWMVS